MAFDIEAAKQAGYSDAEIQSYMASKQPTDSVDTDPMRQLKLGTRSAITGLAALPTMVGGAANVLANVPINLLNRYAGAGITPLGDPAQILQQQMTKMGLPEPQTPQERIYSGIQTGAAAAMTPGGISRMAQPATQTGRALQTMLATKPGTQMMAGGAGLGASEGVRELGGGPAAQIGAGLAASVLAPVTLHGATQVPMAAFRGAKGMLEPFFKGQQGRIVGSLLKKMAQHPERSMERLAKVDEVIPGSQPTAAQAARDYGFLEVEKGLKGTSPGRFAERIDQQNLARYSILDDMAQGETAVVAAKNLRDKLALPVLDQAKKAAKPVQIKPIVNQIDKILSGEAGKRDIVRTTVTGIRNKLFKEDGTPETDLSLIYGVRKHIGDLLDKRLAGEAKNVQLAEREVIQIRNAIDQQMTKASPNWNQYLDIYRNMSKPINQMEAAQDLLERVVTTASTASGEPLITAAKWHTNFTKNYKDLSKIFTPKQMNQLNKITKDLEQTNLSANSPIKPAGSDTFQNFSVSNILGHMLRNEAVPSRTGPMYQTMVRPLGFIYKVPDRQMMELLTDAMMDPKLAHKLMMKASPRAMKSVAEDLQEMLKATAVGVTETATAQSALPAAQ